MVLATTGVIKFSDIQTEFGGTNPIKLSEYYTDNASGYTAGITGIPSSGNTLNISVFRGKAKVIPNYMTSGNALGSMATTGGTAITIFPYPSYDSWTTANSRFTIGTIGFPFYFFDTDFGTTSNICVASDSALIFGRNAELSFLSRTVAANGEDRLANWAKGVYMGVSTRKLNSGTYWAPTEINGHKIKRYTVSHTGYFQDATANQFQMDIRLIRGPEYQYIEIRLVTRVIVTTTGVTKTVPGQWNLTDGTTFKNTFSASPPITPNQSLVLRSDLNGNTWTSYNNYYMNI